MIDGWIERNIDRKEGLGGFKQSLNLSRSCPLRGISAVSDDICLSLQKVHT